MDTLTGIRDRAWESLHKKWGKAAMTTFIYSIIVCIPLESIDKFVYDGLGSLVILLAIPLMWGFSVTWLSVARGSDIDYGQMFDGYKDFKRIFLTGLLQGIYTFLWSLLLIIPGIIKSYSYSMTPYILSDDPEIRYDAAIEKSMGMMKGHKAKLFLLDLSFIGWFILCLLTLGIGCLWLGPYVETSHAKFYEDLLAENNEL